MHSSHAHKKYLILDDVKELILKCPGLEMTVALVQVAFSYSKILHVKEMEDIDKYTRIELVEFIEFIARVGVILFHENAEMLLTDKIERVMQEMFKLISEKVKHPPKTEDDELVSDYEDDFIQLARKKIKEATHEQFLIVDITKKSTSQVIH